MKTLPAVTLDLRKAALNRGADHVEMIDKHERTVARIYMIEGDFDHAGIMVDRINHFARTVEALRILAIIPTMATGVRHVVHDGHRCRLCASTWDLSKPEKHQDWCALKGTEQ